MQQNTQSNTQLDPWQQKLADRGILEQALEAGWSHKTGRYGDSFWTYPVWNEFGEVWTTDDSQPLYRNKNMGGGDTGRKYTWSPSKPDDLHYYLLADTVQAIVAAGVAYHASGEPDHLVYRAAGQANILSWFGEKALPETLAEDLARWGVTTVHDFPDCDQAGYESAALLSVLLEAVGITYIAHRLPFAFGSKGDINQLWIECGFDRDLFWQALIAAEPLDLTPYLPSTIDEPYRQVSLPIGNSVRREAGNHEANSAGPDDALVIAIEAALGVKKYRRDGWSENVKCPFHDDTNPSAGWHRTKHILKCQVCHGESDTYALGMDVAKQLNLLPASTMPKKAVKNGQGEAQTQVKAAKPTTVSIAQIAGYAKSQALGWAADPKKVRGMSTGFGELDKYLSGVIPPDLLVILGRTGCGKSLLAMQMALAFQRAGQVLFYTTEMDPVWTVHRIASFLAGLHAQTIYDGEAEVDMSPYYEAAKKMHIDFAMSERPEPRDIWREAQAFKKAGGKIVIVDSLQNGLPRGMAKYEATVEMCRVLADCQRYLHLPVLATCQANRGPSERKNKEPLPSDAEGGGIIEQSATRLLTLWRPGYDMGTGEVAESPDIDPTVAWLTIRKDRWFGKLGQRTQLQWLGQAFKEIPLVHVDLREHEPYRQGELL